jgi:hypothetical protein
MTYTIIYSEYMEYEEDIEAVNIEEAKSKFESSVTNGEIEPIEAKVMQYKVEPNV